MIRSVPYKVSLTDVNYELDFETPTTSSNYEFGSVTTQTDLLCTISLVYLPVSKSDKCTIQGCFL